MENKDRHEGIKYEIVLFLNHNIKFRLKTIDLGYYNVHHFIVSKSCNKQCIHVHILSD